MFWRIDNARSIKRRHERLSPCDSLLDPGEEPPLGCHLSTPRAAYTHHGIYVGSGRVIYYAGLAYGLRRGPVEDATLECFAHGRDIQIRHDDVRFDRREVVERARSRLGERRYRLLTNNCEHFCAWALRDESRGRRFDWRRISLRGLYRAIRAKTRLSDPRRRPNTTTLALPQNASTWSS
jgi:hypothetical protein